MSAAYFKVPDPAQKLLLGDGSYLTFTPTGSVGTLIVGKQYWLDQIRAVIARHVGGVEEISYAEYEALQKKKTQSSPSDLRELVSVQQMRDVLRGQRDAKAADGGRVDVKGRFGERGTIQAIEHKPVIPGFKPNSVKR